MTIQIVLDVNGVLVKRKWTGGKNKMSPDDNVIPMPTKKGCQYIRIRPHAIKLTFGTLRTLTTLTNLCCSSTGHVLVVPNIREIYFQKVLVKNTYF